MDQPATADSRLSNYRLERLLGSGGMGSVYLARDLVLDRLVAIKFIAPERAGDDSARRRLLREARAAAGLDHPNICGVHEVIDSADGRACIVMQYVQGRTLAETLRDGALDVRLALTIAADLASALAAAHKHGITHRDLKPQNIIITPEHRAKLLDFGLAHHRTSASAAAEDTTTTQLTTPGAIVGTPPYMSPEQLLQRPLDGRSDLFALGAVLFECLTGRRPFGGRSGIEQLGEVLHRDPPAVSSLRSGLTDQHDELVRRLLAKAPEDRFQSAEEVLGALRVLPPHESSGSWRGPGIQERRTPLWDYLRRRTTYVTAAVMVILAVAGIWRWSTPAYVRAATPETWQLYEQGSGWIRAGAYHSARRDLTKVIESAPGFVPAYLRLAETLIELDDHRATQEALNEVRQQVPDETDLRTEDRLRLRAVQALLRRDVDGALGAYEELADRSPSEAGTWLDLSRAQEAAALPTKALASLDRALQLEPTNAAAHLQRAVVKSQLGEKEEALREFANAEQLYSKSGNIDGHTEALIRRGAYLNSINELPAARESLEKAVELGGAPAHRGQWIRAQLQLSSVIASEGHFSKAREIAQSAVDAALAADLDTVAADGLVDLGIALLYARLKDSPDQGVLQSLQEPVLMAIQLAERRNAQRIAARAKIQHAALLADFERPAEALAIADDVLRFLRENQYRRLELQTLLIKSRSLQYLKRNEEGRRVSEDVLRAAERVQDYAQVAFALENLAGFAVAAGDLPGAEEYRRRTEEINRQQKNESVLPYDLTNRAELLIRLGRTRDALPLLEDLDAGISKGIESYKGRARRSMMVRALGACISGNYPEALRLASAVIEAPAGVKDGTGRLASALHGYASARLGRRVAPPTWSAALASNDLITEARYWTLYGRLLVGDAKAVLSDAETLLATKDVQAPPEFMWRIAALASAAARGLSLHDRAGILRKEAVMRLETLEAEWKGAAAVYRQRADLMDLVNRAELFP